MSSTYNFVVGQKVTYVKGPSGHLIGKKGKVKKVTETRVHVEFRGIGIVRIKPEFLD